MNTIVNAICHQLIGAHELERKLIISCERGRLGLYDTLAIGAVVGVLFILEPIPVMNSVGSLRILDGDIFQFDTTRRTEELLIALSLKISPFPSGKVQNFTNL